MVAKCAEELVPAPVDDVVSCCRICWVRGDSEWDDQLLTPCSCHGSMRHVHRRCLERWQRSLRAQGYFQKAQYCEVCFSRYRTGHWQLPWLCSRLPGEDHTLLWRIANFVFEGWQVAVVGAGVVQGLIGGLKGARRGAATSWNHLGKLLSWTAAWVPELSLAAALAPSLRAPVLRWGMAVGAVSALDLSMSAAGCGLLGASVGFARGSIQMIDRSMHFALRRIGRCVVFGLKLAWRAMDGMLQDGMPIITILVSGTAASLR